MIGTRKTAVARKEYFDPNQDRAHDGKWTSGSVGSAHGKVEAVIKRGDYLGLGKDQQKEWKSKKTSGERLSQLRFAVAQRVREVRRKERDAREGKETDKHFQARLNKATKARRGNYPRRGGKTYGTEGGGIR